MSITTVAVLGMDARRALADAGTNRQGARVPARRDGAVWRELTTAGLIGPDGGLTRAGTIARQREMDRAMDELFPL